MSLPLLSATTINIFKYASTKFIINKSVYQLRLQLEVSFLKSKSSYYPISKAQSGQTRTQLKFKLLNTQFTIVLIVGYSKYYYLVQL